MVSTYGSSVYPLIYIIDNEGHFEIMNLLNMHVINFKSSFPTPY
jgi:hypothetical protein